MTTLHQLMGGGGLAATSSWPMTTSFPTNAVYTTSTTSMTPTLAPYSGSTLLSIGNSMIDMATAIELFAHDVITKEELRSAITASGASLHGHLHTLVMLKVYTPSEAREILGLKPEDDDF